MDFGSQIKDLRKTHNLTQEEFALKLNVTRQAISNWENNRNLPDIQILIEISNVFSISLDQLILGGNKMNNMTEKLIKDGNESHRAKLNLLATIIGALLLVIGFTCLIIKTLSVEYVDASGILHENFFLIPIGLLFMICGAIVIIGTGMRFFIINKRNKKTK